MVIRTVCMMLDLCGRAVGAHMNSCRVMLGLGRRMAEINIQRTGARAAAAGVTATAWLRDGVMDRVPGGVHIPVVEGDNVDTLPVLRAHVGPALDQHHGLASLDDGAVGVPPGVTSCEKKSANHSTSIQFLFLFCLFVSYV